MALPQGGILWFTLGMIPRLLLILSLSLSAALGQADYKRFFDEENVPNARRLFQAGRYDLAQRICEMAFDRGQPSVEWKVLHFQALNAQGRYEEAISEAIALPATHPDDIPALMAAHDMLASYGKTEEAGKMLTRINEVAVKQPKKERTKLDSVALGRAALALGADPAEVMKVYFDPVKNQKPKSKDDIPEGLIEAHAASGWLALEKSDYKRAADEFQKALSFEPNDPELRYGLARAFQPSDSEKTDAAIKRALDANPAHVPSALIMVEQAINSERYDDAQTLLEGCLTVNPVTPLAHALSATIANLTKNDLGEQEAARQRALESWPENPEVDHTIGRVLSRNYRFEEGAAFQQRALQLDPDYLPAKLQLAHDNLRLGREDEAWALAEEVSEADPYDVLSFNLTVLRDEIAEFATIESADFTIRLPQNEAEVYGDRAMEILTESKRVLCEKYGLILNDPVLVEFFPSQQDFAIRTFGNLGGRGILGACFGTVVTMNSPGGLAAGRNNWEATLWHEFCHVVTLSLTNNKMPRWLSEGISVYEEELRDPTWGQRMSAEYRKMILEEEAVTPISIFSSAFTNPKTGQHLMFAYYQANLFVRYYIENFGIEAFRSVLADLRNGVLINDALAAHSVEMEKLEEGFIVHVFDLANNLAPEADWTVPEPEQVNPRNPLAISAFLKRNPKNLWALRSHTQYLLAQEKWEGAIEHADRLIDLHPDDVHGANGYILKAQAYRALEKPEMEAETLRLLASKSSEAHTSYLRLMDLDLDSENWSALATNADRAAAIDPFNREVHYCLGCSHQATGKSGEAVESFETLLDLGAINPSEIRYRLATLLKSEDKKRAKRYLLDSLADSPRYREAHRLLLDFDTTKEESETKE